MVETMNKSILSKLLIILFFFSILCFPKASLTGAKTGLQLWFFTLLPSLLPCMILGQYIQQFPMVQTFGYQKYAVVIGFLCGYPTGAKIVTNLYQNHNLTKKEAQNLVGFCNNPSPNFLISYVYLQHIKNALPLPLFLCLLYLPPIIFGIGIHFYSTKNKEQKSSPPLQKQRNAHDDTSVISFDSCIVSGYETICKVGGYVLLFSVLSSILLHNLPLPTNIKYLLVSLLEVTGGVHYLCQTSFSPSLRFLLCGILSSFGGICTVAQTAGILKEGALSIGYYILHKSIQCGLLVLLFLGIHFFL